MPKFTKLSVAEHIRAHHPGCPEFAVEFFASEIARKRRKGPTIGREVGIMMQNYLRHHMTDYDRLLLEGIDRTDARTLVGPRIRAMLAIWRRRPTP